MKDREIHLYEMLSLRQKPRKKNPVVYGQSENVFFSGSLSGAWIFERKNPHLKRAEDPGDRVFVVKTLKSDR